MKPERDIHDAWIAPMQFIDADGIRRWHDVLYGIVHRGKVAKLWRTSPILKVQGQKVETENSIYKVHSWAAEDTWTGTTKH